MQGVGNFATKLVSMKRSLRYRKKKVGLIICNSVTIPYSAKIVKIGPADAEIICLQEIIKEDEKRKKITQAKYIAGRQLSQAG